LPEPVEKYLRQRHLQPGLLGQAFAALATVTAWRDLPESTRRDPAVQARLRRDGETLGGSILQMTQYLESLSPQERNQSGRLLREQPELVERLETSIQEEGRVRGADGERLAQVNRILNRVTWRLSRQSPSLLIDDCIDAADRAAERVGLDRQSVQSGPPDWNPVGRPPPNEAMTRQEEKERQIAGDMLKHIGQLVALFGLLVAGVATGAGVMLSAGFLVVIGITAAALIMFVGLILIIVGAIMNNP
jgi:hypothetical protein